MRSTTGDDGAGSRMRPAVGPMVCLVAILAGCTAPQLSASESAVIGGTLDDGDPAVAAITAEGLYIYCSAALISRHTLLTTGRCGETAMQAAPAAAAAFGKITNASLQSIAITDVMIHPMYTSERSPYDFAVVKLASDPSGIAVMPLNDLPLGDTSVGRAIRHVGFGGYFDDSTRDDIGVKRTGSGELRRVDATGIYSGDATICAADSGAPGLMVLGGRSKETIAGVVSTGLDCQVLDQGMDNRVDVVKDWLVQTVGAWDAPPTFGDEIGTGGGGSGSGGGSSGPGDGSDTGTGTGPGGDDPPRERGTATAGCAAAPGAATGAGLWLFTVLAWLRRRRAR